MRVSHTMLAAVSAMVFSPVPAAATVYMVNVTAAHATAIGSITTDGTLGTLAQSNITDWTLDLNDGISTFTLSGTANSQRLLIGSGLTASATGLFFDFSGNSVMLFQNPTIGSGKNFLCFTATFLCGGGTNGTSIAVLPAGRGYSLQQGVQQVATFAVAGVPEPATWAMMLAGFGMIGFAARRRQSVKTTVSYA